MYPSITTKQHNNILGGVKFHELVAQIFNFDLILHLPCRTTSLHFQIVGKGGKLCF